MKDFQKAMKLSICFGLIGAILVPLMYECYANISRTVSLVILAGWAVFIGIRYSMLSRKAAMLAASAGLAYTFGLGLICYILVHNAAVSMLSKNSKYFYLTIKEQLMWWLYAVLIILSAFVVMFFVWGIKYAVKRIRSNSEQVGDYINNAFDDSGDVK